jgi:hypothetical protein
MSITVHVRDQRRPAGSFERQECAANSGVAAAVRGLATDEETMTPIARVGSPKRETMERVRTAAARFIGGFMERSPPLHDLAIRRLEPKEVQAR